MSQTIPELVRKAEQDFQSGVTTLSRHVTFSLRDTLDRIDAYHNSKHITGDKDSLNRDKPFFNIVTASENIWYRATDIDRANIRIKATQSSDLILALLYNVHFQNWMKEANFGKFLNDWGRVLAKYGSAIVEFIEKDGELIPSVLPWSSVIVDAVNFKKAPLIKKLHLTPAELKRNKTYNQDLVKQLVDTHSVRKTTGGENKDNKSDFIPVYEVHGELSLENYKLAKGEEPKEEDCDIFFQQVHVVSFVGTGKFDNNRKEIYDNFTLYVGKEKDPHMITHLIEEDDRVIGKGAVENLFEAQWMVNHDKKTIKDMLDLASKIIFQSSDETLTGRNVLTAIEQGDIILHKPNMPLTQLNNSAVNISSVQADQRDWQNIGMEITSTPDAMRGNTMPSGTPALLAERLQEQASSLFELMTENKGIAIEEMVRRFIFPFLDRQLDTVDEISATLDDAGIRQIDALYIPNQAKRTYNNMAKDMILNNEIPPTFDQVQPQLEQGVRDQVSSQGSQRFFKPSDISIKTWKEVFDGFKKRAEVEVTGEAHDKQETLLTLNTLLKTIIGPQGINEPNARLLYNKILEETGKVSPSELSAIPAPQPVQPPMPSSPSPTAPMPTAGGSVGA